MKRHALTPLLLATALSACSLPAKTPDTRDQAMRGSWQLQDASGLPKAPAEIRLYFHSSPPQQSDVTLTVSGFSGVNDFRGSATLDAAEQRLVIGPLATTRKRGPAPQMQFETAFLQQMEQVVSYQWQGSDTLVLKTLPGTTLTFVQAAR